LTNQKSVTVTIRQAQVTSRKIKDTSRATVVNVAKAEPNEEKDTLNGARTYHGRAMATEQLPTKPLDTVLKWKSLQQAVRAKEESREDLSRIYPGPQMGYVVS
jgi:hypothetical protein